MAGIAIAAEEDSQVKELWRKSMTKSLTAMKSNEYVDVTLVVNGGKSFRAHKLILEASSPYFVSMFRGGFAESRDDKVVLDFVSSDTMDAILNYIYSGEVETINTEELVTSVLEAAHMMQLDGLCQFCFDELPKFLSEDNCFRIWDVATTYDNQQLETSTLEFILATLKTLFTVSTKIKAFCAIDETKLKDLVSFAASKHEKMDHVLVAVVYWVTISYAKRKTCAIQLFDCIEVESLSPNVVKSLLCHKIVAESPLDVANKLNAMAVEAFLLNDGIKTNGTLRLVVWELNKISTKCYSSTARKIRKLSWSIVVKMPSRTASKVGEVGFFIRCEGDLGQPWTCNANVQLRMTSLKGGVDPVIRNMYETFSNTQSGRGYLFVNMGNPPYNSLTNFAFIFEAKIDAEPLNFS